uniref:(northern house mosquito) hypothetical protein n=1 Tax=Culex pipiens TaxID=7175 RepID=A0A8D8MP40_CULPI
MTTIKCRPHLASEGTTRNTWRPIRRTRIIVFASTAIDSTTCAMTKARTAIVPRRKTCHTHHVAVQARRRCHARTRDLPESNRTVIPKMKARLIKPRPQTKIKTASVTSRNKLSRTRRKHNRPSRKLNHQASNRKSNAKRMHQRKKRRRWKSRLKPRCSLRPLWLPVMYRTTRP